MPIVYTQATTTPVDAENVYEVPSVASTDLPAGPDHRTTVPVAPNVSDDATDMLIQRVRGFLTPAVYSSNADAVAYAVDNISNSSVSNSQPVGRQYRAEVLDYLQGRAKRLAAQAQ